MVIGTTKTGEKIDLGKLTIVTEKEPTGYPSGGPTVPGSSTGIGSTMGRGGGRLSPPQYGTGGYATGKSPAEIKAARERVLAEEKARQEAFSRTGGIVGVGQISPYFKTGVQDVKTDSQAIKTATQVADQITKEKILTPQTTKQKNILGFETGRNIETLTESGTNKTYAPIPGTNYAVEVKKDIYIGELSGSTTGETPYNKSNPNVIDVNTGKRVSIEDAKKIVSGTVKREVLSEDAGFEPLATWVGGGQQTATLVSGVATKVVTKLAVPVAGVVDKASQPLVKSTAQVIGSAADDIYNLLSPTAQVGVTKVVSKAGEVASSGVGKKVVETGTTLLKTEVVGEALRQAGLYTPEVVSGAYLVSTPGRVFTPTEETKKAAEKVYTSTRVSYYGGERQTKDEAGNVVKTEKVPGKAPVWESYVEGFVPGIKVATGFSPEFEVQVKEKVEDIPEYKALKTEQEKAQYRKEFKDFYLNVQQIGGTIGQVLIETGGEVTGGGRLNALELGGIKTRAGAIARFGLASGSTGVQEGVYSAELSSKVEQSKLSEQDKLNAAILGGGVAGGFGVLQAGTMGTKYNRPVNIVGELADYPGEPLGDVLGGQVKKIIGVPDIRVAGGLVTTSYGPDITSTTKVKTKTKGKQKSSGFGIKEAADFFLSDQSLTQQEKINKGLGISAKSNIALPGGTVNVQGVEVVPTDVKKPEDEPLPPIPPKDDDNVPPKEDDEVKDETKQEVSTNVPSWANVPSTVPIVAPQGFFLPGFLPIGLGQAEGVRERTKIYDELSAAGKRFQQLSGLPFAQQETIKRKKTVMINGKEFKIGKRVKK